MSHNPERWEYSVERTKECTVAQLNLANLLNDTTINHLDYIFRFALVARNNFTTNVVIGLFRNPEDAEKALQAKTAPVDEPEARPWEEEGGARQSFLFISHHLKNLAGKILTILDASYVNAQQNRAVKQLVKKEIRQKLDEIKRNCFTDEHECDGNDGNDRTNDDVLRD